MLRLQWFHFTLDWLHTSISIASQYPNRIAPPIDAVRINGTVDVLMQSVSIVQVEYLPYYDTTARTIKIQPT